MSDLGDSISKVSISNTPMKNEDVAFPCGLIAKYMFNDKYTLYDNKSARIAIDETNIAHDVDKKYKFKKPAVSNAD